MANGDTLNFDPSSLIPSTTPSTGGANVTVQDLSKLLGGSLATGSTTQAQSSPTSVYGNLAQARARFGQELQNPKVLNLMMASMEAEVGDQGTPAWQAYAESVMNRASATNRSLVDTIIDPYDPRTKKGYYPPSTMNKLGAQMNQSQVNQYGPIIGSVLQGSNVSNLATGNESGSLRSRPVVFDPRSGERFVAEGGTQDWRNLQQQGLTQASRATQPSPQVAQNMTIAQYMNR